MIELKKELKELEELKQKVVEGGGDTIQLFKDAMNNWLTDNIRDSNELDKILEILKSNAPKENIHYSKRGHKYITKPTTSINWKKKGYERKVIASAFKQLGARNKNIDGKTYYALRVG